MMVARLTRQFDKWMDGIWESRNKIVDRWFLMDRPALLMFICLVYLWSVTKAGPSLMKNRKALSLKFPMMIYNLSQVLINLYTFVGILSFVASDQHSMVCQPIVWKNSVKYAKLNFAFWIFFLNKIVEFLDTYIFIVRKKFNQITILHVYHHFIMPLYCYLHLRFFPGGQETKMAMANSFVHVVMYSYYFLAALGPAVQPYLWWKKYITLLQLAQFSYGIFNQLIIPLGFVRCAVPTHVYLIPLVMVHLPFLYMFSKFYFDSYRKAGSRIDDDSGKEKRSETTKAD